MVVVKVFQKDTKNCSQGWVLTREQKVEGTVDFKVTLDILKSENEFEGFVHKWKTISKNASLFKEVQGFVKHYNKSSG